MTIIIIADIYNIYSNTIDTVYIYVYFMKRINGQTKSIKIMELQKYFRSLTENCSILCSNSMFASTMQVTLCS